MQTDASHPDPEQRGRLAAAIRQQFPAALVDEFQDTDPRQYRILDALYQVAAPRPGTLLAMIGDQNRRFTPFAAAIFLPTSPPAPPPTAAMSPWTPISAPPRPWWRG